MKKSILLLATIAVLAPRLPVATHAATQVYDLNADWSDTQNPNGPWAYREGNNLMHSGSASINSGPAWVGLDTQIFKINGEVIVFPGVTAFGEGSANILWTAPSAGTIEISGAVWDDLSFCGLGSSIWALSHNGNSLSGGQFTCGEYATWNSLFYFSLGSGGASVLQNIPLAAGDQVVLEIRNRPSGFGTEYMDGFGTLYIEVSFTITLTANSGGCPNASFAEDAIIWHQPLARNGASEDTDPSAGRTVKIRFKRGSTIPIQIHALGCTADVTSNPNVVGSVAVFGDSNCAGANDANSVPIDFSGVGGGGGVMEKVGGHLKYNLDTKALPTTTQCYILRVIVTDTSTGEGVFEEVLLQAK